jgi:pimeloyl-ACP methyl ester carboxylesterase
MNHPAVDASRFRWRRFLMTLESRMSAPLRVLYLHGFASSPDSAKVVALRRLLEPDAVELIVPDLNIPSFERLSFEAMAAAMTGLAARVRPRALVGSSLGALLALEVARRGVAVPLVLIAPALGVADRWMARIPDGDPILVPHHRSGLEEPIHRRFFEEMAAVRCDDEPPAAPVVVIMGTDDESVPYERVESRWRAWLDSGRLAPGSHLVDVAGGDHGLLDHVETIAREIRSSVQDGWSMSRSATPRRHV